MPSTGGGTVGASAMSFASPGVIARMGWVLLPMPPGGIAPGGIGLSNWIIILVVVACVLYAVAIYNRLVTQRNRVRNAWSQIASTPQT